MLGKLIFNWIYNFFYAQYNYRGFAAGIYTTNSAEACYHVASNSRANIIVVQDAKQLQKILEIRSNLPLLKAIIQYEGTPEQDDVISVSHPARVK